ncbi:Dimer_Tnp_hAT domain-containing protein [Quillaja saponaria]|uniref:Dimer_Tnp_hAT domain-containing protein n=1 Tax=Quillaja saponaria TaxID=32244 RepID=A0AAD7Q809_QUISA|nr:Dimer_Tnp_hAT domain-containing protein [Quillaja saponaria]
MKEDKHKVCLLDFPESVLESILERLSPAELCRVSTVCNSLRIKCASDYLWKKHMKQKWGGLISSNAYQQSQFNDSIMSCYLSIESGRLRFPAQVYGRKPWICEAASDLWSSQVKSFIINSSVKVYWFSWLAFHFARNPYYVEAFSYAANNSISGYVPLGYNSLRCNLLVQEKVHIERLLKPLKGLWKEKGLSIVTDGWTDAQRRPLINFMAASEGGPIFLSAIDGSKEYKDKHYIASLITNVIKEVGPQKVVQVITDNAPVCKAAGMLVQAEYPHIFWTPCVVHTLNLALKNICAAKNTERNEIVYNECWWITMVSDEAKIIKDFIMNHAMRLAIFNEFIPLKLLVVAETRFASTIVMLKRFKLIKHGLQSMVISDKWNAYREDSVGIAQTVKEIILNDLWWDKVDYILSFTGPIYDMLRLCDTDKPTLHLVYDMWDSMIEQVRTVIFRQEKKEEDEVSDFYNVVYAILIDRWTKSCTPLHCLAHSLNPRYYSKQWLEGLPNRVPPHKDVEIYAERNKCFLKYFPIAEERRFVNIEFARFSGCMDVFASFDSLQDRWDLDPKIWWLVHGSSASLLQNIALKLLGQPCSSSCCERNWSTYSFIHSMRRNKITPQRAEDLVYVHTNLRLLSRKNESYNKGETKMWDIGGDHFDPLEGAENGGYALSCYNAQVSYDYKTDTFQARYSPDGLRTAEGNVPWDRLREPPPVDTSDCDLNILKPGDHIEILWSWREEDPCGIYVSYAIK